ncbi:beta-L-arabinofuranosidase domain-containing protein, partial [Gemmatimonadota bacterium]
PNPAYAEPPLAQMYFTIRVSDENPVPRFAITTSGRDGEQILDGAEGLTMDEWTHIAVSRSGTTGVLYVNGVPVATNPDMTLGPADLGATSDNWLGRRPFPQRNVSYLNASLDDFQVYSRALTGDEVRSMMQSPGGTAGGGGVAWYRFDETDGPTAVDSSGNGRDATVVAPTDGRRHPGFISAYPETQFMRLEEFATYGGSQGIWAPYYTLHKIMAGLIDAQVHTGNDEALEILTGIGDWVHSRLAPLRQEQLDRMWNIYIAGEYGGVNESLAYLHALRPDKEEYLEAAKRFVNNNVYAPTVANEDALDGRHANQHIPQFTGYLRTYEQGNEEEFLLAARNFWDMIVPHRIYSHGGVGVGEMLRERDVIAGSLFAEPNHAETCPLYNMLKLSRNLFFHEPDPKYMNYYELGLFNQMVGSRRDMDSADSPEVTYFVPVQPGQRRSYGNVGTCCGGTGLENHTKYQDSIYFRSVDDSTLFVNLYIASTLEWPEKGFTISQATRFPEEGASTLTIDGRGPLDVKLRVPTWVRKGFTVSINGEAQAVDPVPGTYLTLSRRWSPGDRIEIGMPFSFRAERAIDDPSVQSIYYGPTLMAVQGDPVGEDLESGLMGVSFYRHLRLDGDLAPAMTPSDQPMHFTTNDLTLAPFFIADPVASTWEPPEPESPPTPGRGRRGPPTRPYHIYVRRHEPGILFGSVDSGVANATGPEGLTFLDAVWERAPFADHSQFLSAVEQIATEWEGSGALTEGDRIAIRDAATRAEADLTG